MLVCFQSVFDTDIIQLFVLKVSNERHSTCMSRDAALGLRSGYFHLLHILLNDLIMRESFVSLLVGTLR